MGMCKKESCVCGWCMYHPYVQVAAALFAYFDYLHILLICGFCDGCGVFCFDMW